MKALSLWQPWASLYGCCRKGYETRHWSTDYRGPLAVHAAQRIFTDIEDNLRRIVVQEFGPDWIRTLPRGAVIATGNLVAVHRTELLKVDADEFAQGNFGPGRFAWESAGMRLLPVPIPFTGRQGFFNVPDELLIGHTHHKPTHPQGILL